MKTETRLWIAIIVIFGMSLYGAIQAYRADYYKEQLLNQKIKADDMEGAYRGCIDVLEGNGRFVDPK